MTRLGATIIVAALVFPAGGCSGLARLRQGDTETITSHQLSRWVERPSHIASPGTPPSEDTAIAYDSRGHRFVLFGGKNDKDIRTNELWIFDLSSETWRRIETEGEGPAGVEDHTLIYDPVGHRMVVYGGKGLRVGMGDATWSLDLNSYRWRNLRADGDPWREDHTAVYDEKGRRVLVFGGKGRGEMYRQTLQLDLDPESAGFEHWSELGAGEEDRPQARYDHVAVYDPQRNRMLVYGGWDGAKNEFLDDTWELRLDDSRWRQIKTKKSAPPVRRRAEGVYDPTRNWWIVFGGYGHRGYLNDVWALDLESDIWLNVTPGPQPRMDHRVLYDPQSGRALVYGGDARLPTKFRDMWELEIDLPRPLEDLLRAAYD